MSTMKLKPQICTNCYDKSLVLYTDRTTKTFKSIHLECKNCGAEGYIQIPLYSSRTRRNVLL